MLTKRSLLTAIAPTLLATCGSVAAATVLDNDANRTDPGPGRNLAPPGTNSLLLVLGSGNPLPNPFRRGPSSGVIVDGKLYLFDAGAGIWAALGRAASLHGGKISVALDVDRLSPLFLTHLHPDHTVGLPELIMLSWYLNRATPINIFGPPGTERRVKLIIEAWKDTIDFDLANDPSSPKDGWRAVGHDVATSRSQAVFEDGTVKIEAFQHKHFKLPYNYAYRVTTPDRVIVIGGDSASDDRLIEAARDADVFMSEVITQADLKNAPWGGDTVAEKEALIKQYHLMPIELARIATKARVKTLILGHVQNYSVPFEEDAVLKEVRQHYQGTVYQARDSDIF